MNYPNFSDTPTKEWFMDMLELALKSKVPFVKVTTDDLIHVDEVLRNISDEEVSPFNPEANSPNPSDWQCPEAKVLYTSDFDYATPKVYLACKSKGVALVFINTKSSVMFFDGGTLIPSRSLVTKHLNKLISDPVLVDTVLPSFGGLTLKDTQEVVRLTSFRDKKVSPEGISETRQGYTTKLKGIQQVDLESQSFYQAPSYLQAWLDDNAMFFKDGIHHSLVPRGLLFDGPPGTGKTKGAKFIAQRLNVPLYHLDVGAMKGKYVGDSEGNLNAALKQIDMVEPCVVILDEVEKIFQDTGDHGVTTSMLSTLLWWLQEHKSQVFTVMTTNKKAIIPEELYREGRIDQVMTFNGLESVNTSRGFARQAFTALAKSVWGVEPEADFDALDERLQLAFMSGGAVSQSRVIEMVKQLVKSIAKENANEQH
jgi:Cdc6-like AAA superfamily ATPase